MRVQRRRLSRVFLGVALGALAGSCGARDAHELPLLVQVPHILLSQLTSPFHLRLFPPDGRTCNTQTGRIQRAGVDAYDFPGGAIAPHLRCDTARWPSLQNNFAFGSPPQFVTAAGDDCYSATTISIPRVTAGSYLLLIEASGASTMNPGMVLLGSGCASISPTAGQNLMVTITMQTQPERGVCGDMVVQADESCDDGRATDNCNVQCRFPERTVNVEGTGNPHQRPSVSWRPGGRLVVGFDSSDDVFYHLLSDTAAPTGNSLADSRDLSPLSSPAFTQQAVRVVALDTTFVAAWEDLNTPSTGFNINGQSLLLDPTSATAPSAVTVNTVTRDMRSQTGVSLAASGTTVGFVYQDVSTLRFASVNTASGFSPTESAMPLVAPGSPGGDGVADARLATLGDGTFVAAWSANGADGSRDIFLARLSAAGVLMGSPIVANATTSGVQDQPALAAGGTDVVLAWRDASGLDPLDNSDTTVRWRHFSAALTPDGADRIAPTTTAGAQGSPTIALGSGSTVLLAWEDTPSGTIRGRLHGVDGATRVARLGATTNDFEVDAVMAEATRGMGPRFTPVAAFGGAGRFVVAWEDRGLRSIQLRTLIP